MQANAPENFNECLRFDAAIYLDGELPPAEELAFEAHLAHCGFCLNELNTQKKMISALDSAMSGKNEIELPKDFAKIVAVNAESKVSGLRSGKERKRAFLLCAMFFPIVLAIILAEPKESFPAFRSFAEQSAAVGSFAWHLVYGSTVGISVIAKSLSKQFVFDSDVSILSVGLIFIVSFVFLSRLLARYHRS